MDEIDYIGRLEAENNKLKSLLKWHSLNDLPVQGEQVLVKMQPVDVITSGYVFFDVAIYDNGVWDKDDNNFKVTEWRYISS